MVAKASDCPADVAPLDRLREALELTRRMLEPARAGEWERVRWLESRRQHILKSWFSHGELPSPETVQTVLRQILDVDREVYALVVGARDHSARMMRQAIRGRAAARAYQEAGGGRE